MLRSIRLFWQLARGEHKPGYQAGIVRGLYQPEPPLGFVSRRDPNFYYLSKRAG